MGWVNPSRAPRLQPLSSTFNFIYFLILIRSIYQAPKKFFLKIYDLSSELQLIELQNENENNVKIENKEEIYLFTNLLNSRIILKKKVHISTRWVCLALFILFSLV